MIKNMLKDIEGVYIAYGATDFRKQTASLCSIVKDCFKMDPYNHSAYIFCNKARNRIRFLCYDKNGFILAQKSLLDVDKMKFQWPRHSRELNCISKQQLNWLLSGLKIEQKNVFKNVELSIENVAN